MSQKTGNNFQHDRHDFLKIPVNLVGVPSDFRELTLLTELCAFIAQKNFENS